MATAFTDVILRVPVDQPQSMVVRFAGDSGDGMQLTGGQFTLSTALSGNDLATFPDFPAEIRAPTGTTFGVSSFQINFGSTDIETAGDEIDVLVAMNPAALKVNLAAVRTGGTIIADVGEFGPRNLAKAGYAAGPLESGALDGYQVLAFNISQMTLDAVAPFGLGKKEALRCKNMWTLGLALWLFDRDRQPLHDWLRAKFAKNPVLADANIAALDAGHAFGETAELGQSLHRHHLAPARVAPGLYRTVTGAESLSLGLVAGSQLAGVPLFFGSYPITPASPLLHHLSRLREYGVTTFQAEDEIAAICSAIGASYAGSLGVTSSSGPGIALKGEALGLAIMTELPLVVVNSQRGGPSTGLPTKTEQSDLYQAVYGRNGDAPLAVLAARSAADCFEAAIEACRIATRFMTPVMLLTDGYIANAAEPWRVPSLSDYAPFPVRFHTEPPPEGAPVNPYARDPATLGRVWIRPGTPGLEHRIGGLEKSFESGHISYEAANHQKMTDTRAEKILRIADHVPEQGVTEGEAEGDLAVVGWGSTYGPIIQAVRRARSKGLRVSHIHVRHLWPLPRNLGDLLKGFTHVLVPEMNNGQFKTILRDQYLIDARPLNKVSGQPFKIAEIEAGIVQMLGEERAMTDLADTRKLTPADFATDQEVRWCPGCGDYAILKCMQRTLPEMDVRPENTVFISGIGCSSRFPYYMATYGFHTIHGRAPAIATGVKLANPQLDVWVITGDGDALSIGGNHTMHAIRRNVDLNILLFNNEIYGLTKGQYSPTSRIGTRSPSTPFGSVDRPLTPLAFALGAGARFIARTIDTAQQHMPGIFRRAHAHKGASFVEIFQNCIVYNDAVFASFTEKAVAADTQLLLEHGKPMIWGKTRDKGLVLNRQTLRLEVAHIGEGGVTEADVLVHDETNRTIAHLLVEMEFPAFPMALGVLYCDPAPTYEAAVCGPAQGGAACKGAADFDALLRQGQTWMVR